MKNTCASCDWNNDGVCCVMPAGQRCSVKNDEIGCQYYKHSIQLDLPLKEDEKKDTRQLLKD